jgi:hypothetical protein
MRSKVLLDPEIVTKDSDWMSPHTQDATIIFVLVGDQSDWPGRQGVLEIAPICLRRLM